VINNITYFAEGKNETKFELAPGIHFITPICYEVLFPSFIRSILLSDERQVNFLINLTNDSWYGKTVEIEQHLFLAKWRALEFAIPIIRSTNTGITSVIYPDGSESNRLTIYREEILDHKLMIPKSKNTLYLHFGFEVVSLLALILMLLTYFLEKPSFSKS
jgi:apolipoprotein N-acyltransferase